MNVSIPRLPYLYPLLVHCDHRNQQDTVEIGTPPVNVRWLWYWYLVMSVAATSSDKCIPQGDPLWDLQNSVGQATLRKWAKERMQMLLGQWQVNCKY